MQSQIFIILTCNIPTEEFKGRKSDPEYNAREPLTSNSNESVKQPEKLENPNKSTFEQTQFNSVDNFDF